MKPAFLTLDFEEWFDLEYLQRYALDKSISVALGVEKLLEVLDNLNVRASFFVLDSVAKKNKALLRDILQAGHEIGSHGLTHRLLSSMPDRQFETEVRQAKANLEEMTGVPVLGYRAPCFSMNSAKLEIVRAAEFKYDSSVIDFSLHPLYGTVDLAQWTEVSEWIYRNDEFHEFKIPTTLVLNRRIPISGGGYLRIFPFLVFRLLLARALRHWKSYLLYIHPFECTLMRVPLAGVGWKDQLRFWIGRKRALPRVQNVIRICRTQGFEFLTFGEYLKNACRP